MTAKCWMAANFPVSMRQLIPILDIVAHANKHLGRVSSFMRKYGDMDLFPVKLQVGCALQALLSMASHLVVGHCTRFAEFEYAHLHLDGARVHVACWLHKPIAGAKALALLLDLRQDQTFPEWLRCLCITGQPACLGSCRLPA